MAPLTPAARVLLAALLLAAAAAPAAGQGAAARRGRVPYPTAACLDIKPENNSCIDPQVCSL